jgi:predicted DNA-binding transcriptional regulator YafY
MDQRLPDWMLVKVVFTSEEALSVINALEKILPMMVKNDAYESGRAARNKLANAVDELVRNDASGKALRHLEERDRRTK